MTRLFAGATLPPRMPGGRDVTKTRQASVVRERSFGLDCVFSGLLSSDLAQAHKEDRRYAIKFCVGQGRYSGTETLGMIGQAFKIDSIYAFQEVHFFFNLARSFYKLLARCACSAILLFSFCVFTLFFRSVYIAIYSLIHFFRVCRFFVLYAVCF